MRPERPLPLRAVNLDLIAAGRATVPGYDRAALVSSVVHMSVGSFHRSHQAVYLDDLARRGHTDWGLTGIGLRRAVVRDALAQQDGLYTVVSRGHDGDEARVIGVMGDCLFAGEERTEVRDLLADPRTRLVTLTLTAAGYDLDDPEIRADLADPEHPTSALGRIVEALDVRRRAGGRPFTVLSCDNLTGNGRMTRRAVLALAERRDPALAAWLAEHGAFPSSMVDRITPQTTDADRARLAQDFGIEDLWPVVTEPFSEWVVEDDFSDGRPPLDEVGVRFVSDVTPYALRKTRLLNAAHCALGALGGLAGHERTDEAMRDPVLDAFVRALLDEVTPLLPDVAGESLPAYRQSVLRRLANPCMGDRLERLRRNGSSKVPSHVLSSIREAGALGLPRQALVLAVAAWCRTAGGRDELGRPLAVEDAHLADLVPLAGAAEDELRPLLVTSGLFGDLAGEDAFVAELARALDDLRRVGAHAAVELRLRGDRVPV